MRFQDKVAIVTGGTSGIGKEVATRFVAEGGSVVVNGRDAGKAAIAAQGSILAESAQLFRSAISLSPRRAKRW